MIVEFNGRKFNKVLPEELTIGHLEKLEEVLEDTILAAIKIKGDNIEGIADFIKASLNSKMYSRLIPMVFINEKEADFDEETYEERVMFFKKVKLSDEIHETLGKFLNIAFMELMKSFHVRLNMMNPQSKKS